MATLAYEFQLKAKPRFRIGHTPFEIDEKYMPIKGIGKGSYGVVCSSINVETKEKVAIKKISNVFQSRVYTVMILRELMLLRCIKHTNVIDVKDVMMPTDLNNFNDVYVVYELMDTDLRRIIQSSVPLNNDHCKYFMFQLLSGLKHLHSANVLHRDLKPGNLLVNNNWELKICDFGLARTNRDDNGQSMTEYVVTRWYRAPELLLSNSYGKAVDMWSVGCILAEIIGRQPLFPGTDCLNQLELIITLLGRQEEDDLEFLGNTKAKGFVESLSSSSEGIPLSCLFPHADPMALDLLSKMLVFNPSRRITVAEALVHPYMADLYDPSSSPEAEYRIDIDIDESIGEPILRELMLREISLYHPEVFRPSYLDVLMSNMAHV